jgi:hypothetical protein
LTVNQLDNGQSLPLLECPKPKGNYTGERLLRERPKIYRQVVRLLGEGWSANKICKWCHVTRETVRAVERREAVEISARKKSIIGILGNVAELGASRMEETIGKASLRDAAIGTGIAVDKMCQLTDKAPPGMNIAIIEMPTPAERELLNEAHKRLRRLLTGESPDGAADREFLEAHRKWRELKPPSRYNTLTGQFVDEAGEPLAEQPAR